MPSQSQDQPTQQASNDATQGHDAKPANGQREDQQSDNGQYKQSDEKEKRPTNPAKKRRGLIVGVVIAIVVVGIGVVWYLHSRTYESTDDAQIDGHLNPIASRVNGTVIGVYAENEQPVRAGEALVDLDTKDFDVQVAQARANYEQARAQLEAQSPNVPITRTTNQQSIEVDNQDIVNAQAALASAERDYDSNLAKIRQAQANNRKSQADLARYKQLVDKSEISKSDFDQYLANAGSGDATVDAAQAAADSAAKIVEGRKAQLQEQRDRFAQDEANSPRQVAIQNATVDSRKAQADAAKAQLDSALLNLSYCHIVSPVNGIASERSAEVGGRVSAGQQLVMVVQTESVWVTANFKETQLRRMRVGQTVTIKVDSLGESFSGKVEYMPAATGDKASLFPAENATGNYVKIVQRLPVRIRIDPHQRDFDKLRPGMSAEPDVHLD